MPNLPPIENTSDEPASQRTLMPDAIDNPAEGRFEISVDGHLAQLIYERQGKQLVLIHTEVPEELAGQGIGAMLVRAAIEAAKKDDLAIVAECSYARTWLQRHPDETEGLRQDPVRSR
jgi:predicted GNAT family acetyltransferase